MKKSTFITMILGIISGVTFALGMCMALVAEWDMLIPGVIVGSVGLILGLITTFVYRKMTHKQPIKFTLKGVCITLISIVGTLTLGTGMCLVLIWESIVIGTIIGLVGIILLLCLIPMIKGIKQD